MSDTIEDILLTRKQVAEYLAVCVRKLDYLREREGLPYINLGRQVRFRKEAVDQWLAEKERENG